MSHTQRNCDHCGKEYMADNRNTQRGWGLCCSKSCAAKKREKSKPGYNPERVKRNNIRRLFCVENYDSRREMGGAHGDDDPSWDAHKHD